MTKKIDKRIGLREKFTPKCRMSNFLQFSRSPNSKLQKKSQKKYLHPPVDNLCFWLERR